MLGPVWQELRSKVKRSIIRHPKGVSLARYIERYRFDRPMAKAKMMNLGFRDVLDLLYGMPDLVSIRFVRDYSVSASQTPTGVEERPPPLNTGTCLAGA